MTPDLQAQCEEALRFICEEKGYELTEYNTTPNRRDMSCFLAGYVLAMEKAKAYVYLLPVETNEKRRVTLSIAQWCREQISQAKAGKR